VFSLLELLTRLWYTLALNKCSLKPSNCKRFLGFLVDSVQEAYILPDDKKGKLIELGEFILSKEDIDVRTLQRFTGKCISMSLAIPGCKLFCREVNAGISRCLKNSRSFKVEGSLRKELVHWKFKWRPEFHNRISMYTDSSGFRYGATINLNIGDYW
jgi:hypothetical protein